MRFLFGIALEKCGTTSLYEVLQKNDAFNTTRQKEAFYFNKDYEKGWSYYQSLFEKPFTSQQIITDFTPSYCRHDSALDRLEALEGDKKIMLCLRPPVARAFSHYCHDIRHHISVGLRTNGFRRFPDFSFDGFFRRGNLLFDHYTPLVADIFRRFGRENCLVILLEDMINDWPMTAKALCRHAGLPEDTLDKSCFPHGNQAEGLPKLLYWEKQSQNNWTLVGKWHRGLGKFENLSREQLKTALALQAMYTSEITSDMYQRYAAHFDQDITDLSSLIGRDLTHWTEAKTLAVDYVPINADDMTMPISDIRSISVPENRNA